MYVVKLTVWQRRFTVIDMRYDDHHIHDDVYRNVEFAFPNERTIKTWARKQSYSFTIEIIMNNEGKLR